MVKQGLREFRHHLYPIIDSYLVPRGFERVKGDPTWVRRRHPDFLDVIAVPTFGDPQGPIVANVLVGIHHDLLQKRFAKLRGERYTVIEPTFTTSIGYIMPAQKFIEWWFPRETERFAEEVAHEMCQRMVTHGVPWVERFTSIQSLREGIACYAHWRAPLLVLLECVLGDQARTIALGERLIQQLERESSKGAHQIAILTRKLVDELRGKKAQPEA